MPILSAQAINKHTDENNRGLRHLRPRVIYLTGDPAMIGRLGDFLTECAKELRKTDIFHRHFRDYCKNWDPSLIDIVVDKLKVPRRAPPSRGKSKPRR
jgi:hypothetical protein